MTRPAYGSPDGFGLYGVLGRDDDGNTEKTALPMARKGGLFIVPRRSEWGVLLAGQLSG